MKRDESFEQRLPVASEIDTLQKYYTVGGAELKTQRSSVRVIEQLFKTMDGRVIKDDRWCIKYEREARERPSGAKLIVKEQSGPFAFYVDVASKGSLSLSLSLSPDDEITSRNTGRNQRLN